jgi:hypothetical protein
MDLSVSGISQNGSLSHTQVARLCNLFACGFVLLLRLHANRGFVFL